MANHPTTKFEPVLKNPCVGLISLGCAKNLVDTETIAGHAQAAGFSLAARPEAADIVVINTCAFINDAQQESVDTILEVCSWKAAGPCRAVLVCGCLPQRYAAQLARAMPEVDAFLGLDALPQIGRILGQLARGRRGFFEVSPQSRRIPDSPGIRPLLTPPGYAYLRIAEGCDNRCRYCAIPNIRGAYRSRPLRAILREAETLLQRGVRELNLIAQDTSAYGRDLGPRTDLARLLRALGGIGGRFWIRILYAHPAHLNPRILDAMAAIPQVCRYLDLPIQHSHPDILSAMGRPTPAGGLPAFFAAIRERLPDVVLRTTCLVGFPGETAAHFDHLMNFTAGIRFDHLGVFKFSPETGTPAAAMPRRVAARTAREREHRLMLQQRRIVAAKARARRGATDTVLLERPLPRRPDIWIGRSTGCAPDVDGHVRVKMTNGVQAGRRRKYFVQVRYIRARGYDMEAETIAS